MSNKRRPRRYRVLVANLLVAVLILFLIVPPVLAAVAYQAPVTIVEDDGTTHTMLGVQYSANNEWMADNGFFETTALDTRVETLSGTAKPHMVVDDRTLFATTVPPSSQTNLYFTTGNTDLTSMSIVPGCDGYFTIPDAAALEPADDFEIEQDGYIDTSVGTDKDLVYKEGAFETYISAAGSVTSSILEDAAFSPLTPVDVTPAVSTAWTDVDVSAHIPSGASGVVLHITSTLELDVGVRKNGSTDNRTRYIGITNHFWVAIGVDGSGIFEAYLEDHTNMAIWLVGVAGSNVVFNTNADDISLGATLAWTDIDISVEAPDAIGAIVEVVTSGADDFGLRKNGSSDNLFEHVARHSWAFVGVDGDQKLEGYIDDTDCDFYLVGYILAGATFNTDADDKSIAVTTTWTDIDCSAEAPGASMLIFMVYTTLTKDYGLRKNGSAEDIHYDDTGLFWAVVECDENQVVEGYIETVNVDFYLIGYIVPDATVISVTAAAVSSGEHIVKTTADGIDLKIFIDGVEEDSTALAGSSVSDTVYDWIIGRGNSVVYADYYKHTVGGTLISHYQPVTMVVGTTLPDQEGAAQDATITFGSNPSGVAVELGSLVVEDQPTPGTTEERETRDILPDDAGSSDWVEEPAVAGVLLTHPLRSFVTMVSDNTTLTEPQTWLWYGIAFVLFFTGLAIRFMRGHRGLIGIAFGVSTGAVVAQGVFPIFALAIAILAIVMGVIAERSPSL